MTPCQIRVATDALLRLRLEAAAVGRELDRVELLARLQPIVRRIAYLQRRNQQARRSHLKRRLARFQTVGIDPFRLPQCQLLSAL